jgi:hAT family C-terminal dimerisation region
MCSQGQDNHIGQWFSTLDFVFSKTWDTLCHFQELRSKNPDSPEYAWLEGAANSAWLKCEQYYQRADESPVYYAAEVLQPSRKWVWLHEQWASDPSKRTWLETAKKAVQQLWKEEYKGKFDAQEAITLASHPKHPNDEFGSLSEHRKVKNLGSSRPTNIDPLQTYIERDPEGHDEDVQDYWNSRIQSQPDLAHFALDMLALPVSSAECERIFSSAKLLITASRNRLSPDTIEANECLRAWFKQEKVDKGDEVHRIEDGDWGSGESDQGSDKESDGGEDERESEESDEESEKDGEGILVA